MSEIPRGPIGFRLAHELQGLLEGIRADGRIVPDEAALLERWLAVNDEFTDCYPFNEIAARLRLALADGVVTEEECADLLFVTQKYTTVNPYFDSFRAGLQILMGILAGVGADQHLDDAEVVALHGWLEDWSHLAGLWPYDEIRAVVTTMLARQRIEEERHYLAAVAAQLPIGGMQAVDGDAVPMLVGGVCAVDPEVVFEGRTFVFTGDSPRATREQFAALVNERKGRWRAGLRKDTHYLVVCDGGSPHWAFACYGRKVERAYQLRRAGASIVVVHENDFWDAIGSATRNRNQEA